MDFLLLYHFRKLKGVVAIEIFQVFPDDIIPNMIFEILAIKFLSEVENYLAMATLGWLMIAGNCPFRTFVKWCIICKHRHQTKLDLNILYVASILSCAKFQNYVIMCGHVKDTTKFRRETTTYGI